MNAAMQIVRSKLARLLAAHEATTGMYVRVRGKNLTMGRREPLGPGGELEDDDRVRLTKLNASAYGLSVRRHTGRWERTPCSGSMEEMVEAMLAFMQHLVAPWSECARTSGAQQ